jgi:hypothetical protein
MLTRRREMETSQRPVHKAQEAGLVKGEVEAAEEAGGAAGRDPGAGGWEGEGSEGAGWAAQDLAARGLGAWAREGEGWAAAGLAAAVKVAAGSEVAGREG